MNETTQAFARLRDNLSHARSLIEGGKKLEAQGVIDFDVSGLYRSAWVLAVAALDHWVFEEIHHRMLELILKPDGPKPAKLKKMEIPTSLFDRAYHGGEPLRTIFDAFLREAFRYTSFQKPDNISDGFKHVSDIKLWQAIAKQASREQGKSIDYKTIKDRLSAITQRRNQIAHQADIDPTTPGRRQPIEAAVVTDVITFLENLAAHILMALGD